jgi:hypothetical protein
MGTERPKLKWYDIAWFLHQTAELINGLISDIGYMLKHQPLKWFSFSTVK